MKRIDNWFNKLSSWITGGSFLGRLVWVLCMGVLLVLGYSVLQQVRADANGVAAVAGALAAFAALHAAKESARTAKDATRALAMATKPIPELRMDINRSESDPSLTSMTIQIENLSVHPMRSGVLRWTLRDGTSGSQPVGELRGRSKPFGGFLHRAEGVESLLAAETFNGGIGGVDRVSLDYHGDVRDVRWRSTFAMEWEVLPNQWTELDGVRIPATKRIGYDRNEVEL